MLTVVLDENMPINPRDHSVTKQLRVSARHLRLEKVGQGALSDLLGKPDVQVLQRIWPAILLTKDKRMTNAGRVPRRHGGVIVIDVNTNDGHEIERHVLSALRGLVDLRHEPHFFVGKKFLFRDDQTWEVMPDGSRELIYRAA